MSSTTVQQIPQYERFEFADRYYVQTAKNAIESLTHIVEEAGSNEDEAITRRAELDGTDDSGTIRFAYDPDEMLLIVTGDGDGMTAGQMRTRLKRVGASPHEGARRGFFHRGIREVFLAMGGGEITSIGRTDDGREVISKVIFGAEPGMAVVVEDEDPTDEQRAELGLPATGTRVQIPMRRFALKKPRLFEFGALESQVKNCVGLRPVLMDPSREILLEYAGEPPRRLSFEYPEGEDLVAEKETELGGEPATFSAKVAPKPIKGPRGKRTRTSGILIRGERAAYEVSLGEQLASHPAMQRVFGELRIDGIERMQREADQKADEESQLVYKTDRSGLNPEHPFVEEIYAFVDNTLGPLVADLDAAEEKKQVSSDMRRKLQKLARVINDVLKERPVGDVEDAGGGPTEESEREIEQEPPEPPTERRRYVDDGIGFAYDRIFIEAGRSRTVKVWFDVAMIPEGSDVSVDSTADEIVHAAPLSAQIVPPAGSDGIAELDLAIKAGNTEGRHEVKVSAGGWSAALPVHVRFPRASGFISQILPEDIDWEAGSALWDPSSGVVKVFVGRPEFKDAANRAKRDGESDPWKHREYRQLVVESVREAALWPASVRRAEVEWDELPSEDRQDSNGFYRLVLTEFQELDYLLRAKLHKAFIEA